MISSAQSMSATCRARIKREDPQRYEAYLKRERVRQKMRRKPERKPSLTKSVGRKKPSMIHIIQSLATRIPVLRLHRVDETEEHLAAIKKLVRMRHVFRKDCETCNISFWSKLSFNAHLQECVKVKCESEVSPDDCDMYIETTITEIKLICPVCLEQLRSMIWMSRHLQTHNTNVPFWCTNCNTMFNQRLEYLRHLKEHRNRMFQCKICNQSFLRKDKARSHVYNHLGFRPFACHLCHKSYNTKSHLAEHAATHLGYKPFQCDLCDKSFYIIQRLNTHKRNIHHTKVK